MKRIFFVLLLTGMTATACKKNTVNNNATCGIATVKYMGDPAADGLGWTLFVGDSASNGHLEIPENLAAGFKTHGLVVDICYERTDHLFYCFCTAPYKMINITSIKIH
jgi:hypothetical protein